MFCSVEEDWSQEKQVFIVVAGTDAEEFAQEGLENADAGLD